MFTATISSTTEPRARSQWLFSQKNIIILWIDLDITSHKCCKYVNIFDKVEFKRFKVNVYITLWLFCENSVITLTPSYTLLS